MKAPDLTRSWNSMILSAAAAAIMPATAAVHGSFEKSRDLEVQGQRLQQELIVTRERYVHEARVAYLAQLQQPAQQARVLRFVLATAADANTRAWAEDELRRLAIDFDACKREQQQREGEAN